VNIALGRPTFQSSVLYSGEPSRAVDGNKNPDYNGNSCCHSNGLMDKTNPWWAVDLQQNRLVDRVDLTNRAFSGVRMYTFLYIMKVYFNRFANDDINASL
jgi:hypothetical protein